jgi:hypothetical protein
MVDIQGWRMDDTVALIRGAPDSVVVLDVLPAETGTDGKHKRVTLVRKTISLAEQAAKAAVRSVSDGKITRRIGVLTLPTFYEDFAARQNKVNNYKSATRDVALLLEEFRKQKVDGVLVDLRNNGGGSLSEAISVTGLFIDKGPVVQQRNAAGVVAVGSDTLAGVAWDGCAMVIDFRLRLVSPFDTTTHNNAHLVSSCSLFRYDSSQWGVIQGAQPWTTPTVHRPHRIQHRYPPTSPTASTNKSTASSRAS